VLQHHCVLPSFPKPAQAILFDPTRPSILVIAFPDNMLQFYNVETRQFPAWGKDLSSALPRRLSNIHDPILGVAFDPTPPQLDNSHSHCALLWGSTWICKVSLSENRTPGKSNRKRRRESVKESAAAQDHGEQVVGRMATHYRSMLFLDFLTNGELVVVERPLIDILSTLPPPYFKPKYGAS